MEQSLISYLNICPLSFLESPDQSRVIGDSEVSCDEPETQDDTSDLCLNNEASLGDEITDEPVSYIATGELKVWRQVSNQDK